MAATSPEELEVLLEDALLLGDGPAVEALFEPGGVAVTGTACASGADLAAALTGWYLGTPRHVTVVRDVGVVVGDEAVSVSRQGPDRQWRLVATVLTIRPDRWSER